MFFALLWIPGSQNCVFAAPKGKTSLTVLSPVTGVQWMEKDETGVLEVKIEGPLFYNAWRDGNGNVILDFPYTSLTYTKGLSHRFSPESAFVKKVLVGQYKPDTVRVVLVFSQKEKFFYHVEKLSTEESHTLLFQVTPKPKSFMTVPSLVSVPHEQPKQEQPKPKKTEKTQKPLKPKPVIKLIPKEKPFKKTQKTKPEVQKTKTTPQPKQPQKQTVTAVWQKILSTHKPKEYITEKEAETKVQQFAAIEPGKILEEVAPGSPREMLLAVDEMKEVYVREFVKSTVENPEIAEMVLTLDKKVYIRGLSPGQTIISVWDSIGKTNYTVTVSMQPTSVKAVIIPLRNLRLKNVAFFKPETSDKEASKWISAFTSSGLTLNSLEEILSFSLGREKFSLEQETNSVIIQGTDEEIRRAKALLASLEHLFSPQVKFEIKIVEISEGSKKLLLPLIGQSGISASGSMNVVFVGSADSPFLAALKELESKGGVRVLAFPSLLTQVGKIATFSVGQKVPVPRDDGKVDYVPFGATVTITPKIQKENEVNVFLLPEVNTLSFIGDKPVSSTKTLQVQISLKDSETIALLGLLTRDDLTAYPPFSQSTQSLFQMQESELLILITPKILTHN